MRAEIKELWLAELRSGRRTQGREALKRGDAECCLGVLCDLAVTAGLGRWEDCTSAGAGRMRFVSTRNDLHYELGVLPMDVQEWAGLFSCDPQVTADGVPRELSNLNDRGWTFEQIADAIERDL